MKQLLVLLAVMLGAATLRAGDPLLHTRAVVEHTIRHATNQREPEPRTYTIQSELQDGRKGNFVVTAPTKLFASKVAQAAEYFRYYHAAEWIGQSLPGQWSQPCTIRCKVGNIGAGGQTTFTFVNGEVVDFDMYIQGTEERILDSVLPHEVLHTVFASHFRRPLPRWADEGAASTTEHSVEKAKQTRLLDQVVGTSNRIPLRELFSIMEYPRDMQDVLILYAEGYSVTDFLVQKKSKREFVDFIQTAHKVGWDQALNQHYSYRSVENLESDWLQAIAGYTRAPQAASPSSSSVAARLLYFKSTYCAPCRQFEEDCKLNPQPLYQIMQSIRMSNEDMINVDQRPDLASKYGIASTPCWIILDQYDREMGRVEGYTGLQDLVAKIQPYLRRAPMTQPKYQTPQQPQWQPLPQVPGSPMNTELGPGLSQQQMIDWSQCQVILLISKSGESPVLGAIKEAGFALGSKEIEEYFHTMTGGKGALVIVPERTQPDRFYALLEASQTPKPELVSALITVKEQHDGIKELLTGVVKSTIERRIGAALAQTTAINPFFQRIDPVPYNRILAALQTEETSFLGIEGESPLMKLLTAVVSGLGAMKIWEKIGIGPKVVAWWRRRKGQVVQAAGTTAAAAPPKPPQPRPAAPVKAQAPKPALAPAAPKPAVKAPAATQELSLE